MVSPATHTIPINQGASAQANTGTGITGQALISNGASADPSFQSGGWVLLATLTASNSATLSDTTHITSSYNDYMLVFTNILPVTNAVNCEIQVHSGGSFQTTTYLSNEIRGTGSAVASSTQSTFVGCSGTTGTGNTSGGISGETVLYNASQTSSPKNWVGHFNSPGLQLSLNGGAWNGGNGAIDGFQVLMSSGNITSGTIKIYGRL